MISNVPSKDFSPEIVSFPILWTRLASLILFALIIVQALEMVEALLEFPATVLSALQITMSPLKTSFPFNVHPDKLVGVQEMK